MRGVGGPLFPQILSILQKSLFRGLLTKNRINAALMRYTIMRVTIWEFGDKEVLRKAINQLVQNPHAKKYFKKHGFVDGTDAIDHKTGVERSEVFLLVD